ncbi:MAG TPA: Ti-type conjugative transfer relaxase TraA [Syntrophorhabdus sp.]|nr:Ti-type conjugative transfer relaxase TraA [Syntrophorhabdus sp.]
MASYHISVKIISRGGGKTAIAAAAYRSRDKLYDERQGMEFDYSQKKDLAYAEIVLPDNAPVRLKDREILWNEVEGFEKRKDAQLAREVELALPREFNLDKQIELVREYVQDQFVSKGMIADFCIHKSDVNPHVHIMLTTREITEDGFGKKVTDWNKRSELLKWREEWAIIQNRKLLESGYDIQVDHRSYADRGINLEPQIKIGIASKFLPNGYLHLKETRGLERLEEFQRICRENGERIISEPGKALKLVGHYDAVFKREEIMDFAFHHSEDKDQFNRVLSALENSTELIRLGKNERGEDLYTTRTMLESEKEMLDTAQAMYQERSHKVGDRFIDQTIAGYTMTSEQENAFRDIVTGGDVSIMIGRAGTGKSYTLGAVREACEAQGYRVRGLALSGIAAESLQNESGIPSKTIHRQLLDWNNDRDRLSKNEILVLDEAGMVGTRLMHEVLGHAREAGAKVVLVGDNEQLQSIEAGGSFRGIIHRTGYVELADVRRQKIEWQKDATREFSGRKDQVEKAIEIYRDHGNIKEHVTKEQAKEQLMKDWADYRMNSKQQTSLMLAYTNKDVTELNLGARQYRKLAGDLRGAEYTIMTERGERRFSVGDRIIFLRNESSLGVRNGALGTVERINRGSMAVKLDKGDMVAFDIHMYKDFDHGYAATVHKTQGSTIDRTFVLGTRHFDKHTAYVAMSRHREDVTMYYSKDEFKSFEDLQKVMGRERPKGLIIDYGLPRGVEPDDRLIQAEKMMSIEDRNVKAQEGLLSKSEEQYIKQMQGKGIRVEFPREKAVEGYYTRVEEIEGKKYAVIDTHVDPSKGVRYMIPYEKQYDQMMRHRFVKYDGHSMSYAKVQSLDKGINKGKGPGKER